MRAIRERRWWPVIACAMIVVGQGCGAQDARTVVESGKEPARAAATSTPPTTDAEIPKIAPADLLTALDGGNEPVLLDVRTPEEYAAGHIEGAINIPHDRIENHLDSLTVYRDRDIVVYCRSGRRAEIVERVLRDAGFEGVKDLEGHMVYWTAHELPLATACC